MKIEDGHLLLTRRDLGLIPVALLLACKSAPPRVPDQIISGVVGTWRLFFSRGADGKINQSSGDYEFKIDPGSLVTPRKYIGLVLPVSQKYNLVLNVIESSNEKISLDSIIFEPGSLNPFISQWTHQEEKPDLNSPTTILASWKEWKFSTISWNSKPILVSDS